VFRSPIPRKLVGGLKDEKKVWASFAQPGEYRLYSVRVNSGRWSSSLRKENESKISDGERLKDCDI